MRNLTFVFFTVFTLSLNVAAQPRQTFRSGYYRASLLRPDGKTIAFNFQVKDSAGRKILYVLNAAERLLVDSITTRGDSVFIQMPFFDSYFKAIVRQSGDLDGAWFKRSGEREQQMPFRAVYNTKQRFAPGAKPRYNISGRWDVAFSSSSGDITKAVGEFSQTGNRIEGTFLTTTGDYRYLEGVVNGDSLVLSGFDGGHAFQFTASIQSGGELSGGKFYNGIFPPQSWEGRKDANVTLPSGYDETKMRAGESQISFSFRSTDGATVSLSDERFKNKVVLVQLLGSWCPNCMDETKFLSEYYNSHRGQAFEVVGLAYERTTDFEQSKASLARFQKRFNVAYPILITGVTVADPQRTEKTLPQLAGIKAFPTSIFIDKKGNVRKIHSGFNGPGTGEHFVQFQREFTETIQSLLAE